MTAVTHAAYPLEPAVLSRRTLWTGRVLSGLAMAFLAMDAVGKLLKPAPVVEGHATARVPRERHRLARADPGGLPGHVPGPAHGGARRGPLDGLPRRRDRDARASRESAPHPHALPDLRGGVPLAGALAPRPPGARDPAAARAAPASVLSQRFDDRIAPRPHRLSSSLVLMFQSFRECFVSRNTRGYGQGPPETACSRRSCLRISDSEGALRGGRGALLGRGPWGETSREPGCR